jgi:uncharacterized protein DUF4166
LATLYRRILGDAFDTLPPVLRGFHDREKGGSASGVLSVVHGQGRLCGVLARLGRLPDPATAVPVRLRVVTEGSRERWIREIGDRRLETVQWNCKGLLVEAVGPFRCGYRVDPSREGMRLRSVRGWLYALPLPPVLTPRVEAVVTGQPDAWHVHVRIDLPLLGLLAGYEGEVTPI